MEKAVILIDILKRYFDRLPIRAETGVSSTCPTPSRCCASAFSRYCSYPAGTGEAMSLVISISSSWLPLPTCSTGTWRGATTS